MGITNGNGIGMGMKTRLNLPGSGNRNGNEPFGMGGNGIKKVIPAHLYCVVYPVDRFDSEVWFSYDQVIF